MTKDQALAILKQPDRIGCHLIKSNDEESCKFNQEGIEALNMAIKALEQQPSEDCVSRQAMLDAITEIDDNINMDIYTNEVREIINELPPVTPKIPTSNDCVSRADVFQMIKDMQDAGDCFIGYYTYDRVKNFPPVTPTHGACKDCSRNGTMRCKCFMWGGHEYMSYKDPNFYCADFEGGGKEND